jgi:hypothetical protein
MQWHKYSVFRAYFAVNPVKVRASCLKNNKNTTLNYGHNAQKRLLEAGLKSAVLW